MATKTKKTTLRRPTEKPILTLKIDGPGVRKGRISVPDLIRICQDAQSAVTRQAEAIEGRKTVHPGPTTESIRKECTLELIGIKKGSTILAFGLAKPQMQFDFAVATAFGGDVVRELADTIRSLGNGDKKKDLDPGVLQSIYGLSSVVENGRVSEVKWMPQKSGRVGVSGTVNRKVRDRAAHRLSKPSWKFVQIDGVLDMADFSRKERKCRIDPAIGASVICTFGVEHEDQIGRLMRQAVRVAGIAKIPPHTSRVEVLDIKRIDPLPSLSLGEGNFFHSLSIQELANAQGIKASRDLSALGGLLDADEVDEFVEGIYDAREAGQ